MNDHYDDITKLLNKKLSLEETVFLMEMPHHKYMQSLLKTSDRQKKIARDLGRHFIELAKKTHNKKPRK